MQDPLDKGERAQRDGDVKDQTFVLVAQGLHQERIAEGIRLRKDIALRRGDLGIDPLLDLLAEVRDLHERVRAGNVQPERGGEFV